MDRILIIASALLLSATAVADDRYDLGRSPAAPVELDAYAPLVGEWAITTETLQQDGTWADSPGAQWNFYFILEGHAIQDDWISHAPPTGDPPIYGRGTNIRIYDTEEDRWEMAWIASRTRSLSTYTAQNGPDGSIVMRDLFGVAQPSRITFYDIREDSFEWKLEFTQDEGETWFEVFRIHGTRIR